MTTNDLMYPTFSTILCCSGRSENDVRFAVERVESCLNRTRLRMRNEAASRQQPDFRGGGGVRGKRRQHVPGERSFNTVLLYLLNDS